MLRFLRSNKWQIVKSQSLYYQESFQTRRYPRLKVEQWQGQNNKVLKCLLTRNGNRCHGFRPVRPVLCQWSVWTSCGTGARRPPSAAEKQQHSWSRFHCRPLLSKKKTKKQTPLGSSWELMGSLRVTQQPPRASELWFRPQIELCTCRNWSRTQEAFNYNSAVGFTWCCSYWCNSDSAFN